MIMFPVLMGTTAPSLATLLNTKLVGSLKLVQVQQCDVVDVVKDDGTSEHILQTSDLKHTAVQGVLMHRHPQVNPWQVRVEGHHVDCVERMGDEDIITLETAVAEAESIIRHALDVHDGGGHLEEGDGCQLIPWTQQQQDLLEQDTLQWLEAKGDDELVKGHEQLMWNASALECVKVGGVELLVVKGVETLEHSIVGHIKDSLD